MMFRIFLLISLNFYLISSYNINKRFLDESPVADIAVTTTTPLPSPVEEVPASATTTPLLVIVPSTIPQTQPPLPIVLTSKIAEEAAPTDPPVVEPSSAIQAEVLTTTTTISPVSEAISTTAVVGEASSTTQAVIASTTVQSPTEPIQFSTTVLPVVSSTVPILSTTLPALIESTTLPALVESTTTSSISTSKVIEPLITTTTSIDESISTTSLPGEEVIPAETTTSKIEESVDENEEKVETKTLNDSESKYNDSSLSETNQIPTTTPAANIIICFTKPISLSSNQKNSQSYFDHLEMNPALIKFKNFTLNIIPSRVYDLMKHPSSDLILLTVLIVFIILIVLLIITMCFVFRRRNYATTSLYKRFVENHLVINSSPLHDIPPGETISNYDNRTILTRIRTLKGENNNNEKNLNEITNEQNITLIAESPKQNDTNKKKSSKFSLNKSNNLKCQLLDSTSSKTAAAATADKDKCSDKIHLVKVKNNCFPKLSLFNINPIYVDDKTKIENTHL